MINDLKMGFQVLKYGLSFKGSIFGIIAFGVLGCLSEFSVGTSAMGSIYMAMGSIFMAQLIHSLNVSTMVQTSPYKKKLQTIIPTYVVLLIFIVMNTISIGIKIFVYDYYGRSETELSNVILLSSIMMVIVTLYVGASFKAFWTATIIFFVVFFSAYPLVLIFTMDRSINGEAVEMILPLGASILVSYLLLIAACAMMYFIFLVLYKKEYSKITFQAALKRAK